MLGCQQSSSHRPGPGHGLCPFPVPSSAAGRWVPSPGGCSPSAENWAAPSSSPLQEETGGRFNTPRARGV